MQRLSQEAAPAGNRTWERVQVVATEGIGIDLHGSELQIEERQGDLHSARRSVAGRTHAWYCCLGCLLGFVGFGLTLMSAIADVCDNPEGSQEEGEGCLSVSLSRSLSL